MRDSALKHRPWGPQPLRRGVGEELMRDSALKLKVTTGVSNTFMGRRRAHARQRFETLRNLVEGGPQAAVGEELMRDSALKPGLARGLPRPRRQVGEELMRDSALKPAVVGHPRALALGRRRAHARQRFETSCQAFCLASSVMSEKSSCATAL